MAGHGSADESIALAFLVLGAPLLAQLVHCLHALYFLLGEFSLVALAATAGGLPHAGPRALGIFSIFIEHFSLLAVFDGCERSGPASAVESLFDEGGIHALLLNGLLDVLHVFVFLVGRAIFLEGVLLSENVLLSSDFPESVLDVWLDQGLLFL